MTSVSHIFQFPDCFLAEAPKSVLPVYVLNDAGLKEWLSKQTESIQTQIKQKGFKAADNKFYALRDADGAVSALLCGYKSAVSPYTLCSLVNHLKTYEKGFIEQTGFEIVTEHSKEEFTDLCIGWGWANYKFDIYKKNTLPAPKLVWPDDADEERAEAFINSVCLIRSLVNTPANILNTNELAGVAEDIAKSFDADFYKIVGKDLLDENYPMIYEVGKASENPPQFVEINWGEKDHPKLSIVGKGVVFDTGGLNLKPGQWMGLMKKDMGGSAHALGLAWLIMSLNLPVRLQVLLSIAENSVSDNAFRPGDVIQSRKGLSVEILDTDAEGRLVVADAIAKACEDKPDLLVDFCTLTGAARVALGYDIPAYFSNRDDILEPIKTAGLGHHDPVWPLPLWDGYDREMDSPIADVANDSSMGRAGAIQGGLFLKRFVDPSVDWVHFDCYAWEQYGRAGRPKGGADTGMRAMFHYIESRYGKAS